MVAALYVRIIATHIRITFLARRRDFCGFGHDGDPPTMIFPGSEVLVATCRHGSKRYTSLGAFSATPFGGPMQILDWLCERDDGLAHPADGERSGHQLCIALDVL